MPGTASFSGTKAALRIDFECGCFVLIHAFERDYPVGNAPSRVGGGSSLCSAHETEYMADGGGVHGPPSHVGKVIAGWDWRT